ncbi:hypothetical protein PV328_003813, partial [Microctonus aethiopoides]
MSLQEPQCDMEYKRFALLVGSRAEFAIQVENWIASKINLSATTLKYIHIKACNKMGVAV